MTTESITFEAQTAPPSRGWRYGILGFIVAHLVHAIPTQGQRKWRGMLLVPWVIPDTPVSSSRLARAPFTSTHGVAVISTMTRHRRVAFWSR